MTSKPLRFEVKDGNISWPEIQDMRGRVYPPSDASGDLIDSIQWAEAKRRVLLYADDKLVSVAGLYNRDVIVDDCQIHIAGIGGVMTEPAVHGQGYGKKVVEKSVEIFKHENLYAFAYLFCEDHNIAFYRKLGWQLFEGDVSVEQYGVSGPIPMRNSMFYPLQETINPRSRLNLCGLPW